MILVAPPSPDRTSGSEATVPYMNITGRTTTVTASCTDPECGATSGEVPAYQWAGEHIEQTRHGVEVTRSDVETYSPVEFG